MASMNHSNMRAVTMMARAMGDVASQTVTAQWVRKWRTRVSRVIHGVGRDVEAISPDAFRGRTRRRRCRWSSPCTRTWSLPWSRGRRR